tara:strand:+ start:55 stop:1041 length:987 start_codon:yes stop_codon:yes gene_type:complete
MNNIFQKLLLLFLSIITTILLLEVALRLTGSTAFIKEYVKKPKIYIQDNVLGWNTKEGNYFYDIDSENKVNFYFLNDGSRFSGKELNEQNNSKKIILVGGSFTMGHKINNEETISFYLQESFENLDVKNHGVGGYGTYQSFLKLKKIFKTNKNIKYVFYSFIDHHESRNIGDVTYLEGLSMMSEDLVYFPYVSLNNKENIIEHAPIKYLILPFSNFSVLVSKIQKKIMRIIIKSKYDDKQLITKKLIRKMDNLSKKNGSTFVFVNLLSYESIKNNYEKFALNNNILFLDCQIKNFEKYTSKKIDYHPNAQGNKKYSKCLEKFIKNYVK